jgi:lipoate-protein ligase A
MKCRFMDTGVGNAAWNMSLDEGILRNVSLGASPATLRFYTWSPAAVSIGYFQGIREEVDLDRCFLDKVDVVRRMTGGGAVFHDNELTYSFLAKEKAVSKDILQSYRQICSGIVAGLDILGISAEFAPLNDIVCGGKKISGNAQTRRMGCVLQHGTVLLKVDVDRMFSYLKVPQEKLKGKLISDVKQRVTSVKDAKKVEVTYEAAAKVLERGFAKAMKLELSCAIPSMDELSLAKRLESEKYSCLEWNAKR